MERPPCLTVRTEECHAIDRIQTQTGSRQRGVNGGSSVLPGTPEEVLNACTPISGTEPGDRDSLAVSTYQPLARSMPRARASHFDVVPHLRRKIGRTPPPCRQYPIAMY